MNIKNYWTESDVMFLKENYHKYKGKELLKMFEGDYTIDSLRIQAKKYGLTKTKTEYASEQTKTSLKAAYDVLNYYKSGKYKPLKELCWDMGTNERTFNDVKRRNKEFRNAYESPDWKNIFDLRCCKCDCKLSQENYSKYGRDFNSINTFGGAVPTKKRMCDKCYQAHQKTSTKKGSLAFKIYLMFKSAYHRSKKNNWEFTLTEEYLMELHHKQKGCCYFSGEKLTHKSNTQNSISLDRIDSKKGYIKGNVCFTTWEINSMKSNYTNERFIELCHLISDNFKLLL